MLPSPPPWLRNARTPPPRLAQRQIGRPQQRSGHRAKRVHVGVLDLLRGSSGRRAIARQGQCRRGRQRQWCRPQARTVSPGRAHGGKARLQVGREDQRADTKDFSATLNLVEVNLGTRMQKEAEARHKEMKATNIRIDDVMARLEQLEMKETGGEA